MSLQEISLVDDVMLGCLGGPVGYRGSSEHGAQQCRRRADQNLQAYRERGVPPEEISRDTEHRGKRADGRRREREAGSADRTAHGIELRRSAACPDTLHATNHGVDAENQPGQKCEQINELHSITEQDSRNVDTPFDLTPQGASGTTPP